jgi:hypothetical protein
MGVCIDASGAIYVSGMSGGYLQGLTNVGVTDHFVVKMTADGDQTWIRFFGSSVAEYAGNCAVDVFGNLYVVGQTNGGQQAIVTNSPANGYSAVYLIRLAQSTGVPIWNKTMSSGGYQQYLYSATFTDIQFFNFWPAGRGVAVINPIVNVTTNVTVIVSFFTANTLSYIDAAIPGAGNYDSVIGAYNGLTGAFRWANYYMTSTDDVVTSTATDATGATFVVGYTSSTLDGGLYNGNGNPDIFFSKLDLNGNKLWTRVYGTPDSDWGSAVSVDNAGGVYVSGFEYVSYTAATAIDSIPSPYGQLESSANNVLVSILSKFDSDGSRLWSSIFGAYMPSNEPSYYPAGMQTYSSAFDSISGNLYVAGQKVGIWLSDTWPFSISVVDLYTDQAFLMAVQQSPTNCTLQQLDSLLAQIDQRLVGF